MTPRPLGGLTMAMVSWHTGPSASHPPRRTLMGPLSPPRRATLRCQWISPKQRQIPLGPSPLNQCQAWSFCFFFFSPSFFSAKTSYLFPPGGFVFANFEGCSGSKTPVAYPQFQCSGDHPRQQKAMPLGGNLRRCGVESQGGPARYDPKPCSRA